MCVNFISTQYTKIRRKVTNNFSYMQIFLSFSIKNTVYYDFIAKYFQKLKFL